MRWLRSAPAIAAVLLTAAPAGAHPAPFTYFDFRLGARAIDASLVVHVFDVAHDLGIDPPERLLDARVLAERTPAIVELLRPRIRLDADGRTLTPSWSPATPEVLAERQSLRLQFSYALERPAGALALSTLMFPYDPNHQTFVNIYEDGALATQAILDRDHTRLGFFTATVRGHLAAVRTFAPAGMRRALGGWDHLSFLAGLLLLGGSLRRLGALVAAFSGACSAAFLLAALDIVYPPARVVGPAVALSIIFVGLDNVLVRGGRDVRLWTAIGFGLFHGAGFAQAFRALDLSAGARTWGLLSFNLGVETGLLLAAAAVLVALTAFQSRGEAAARRFAFAGSLVVIAAGALWFIQRAFFPGAAS